MKELKKTKNKAILSTFFIVIVSLCLTGCGVKINVKVGDIYKLGTYKQESIYSDEVKPIEWIVLSVDEDEGEALLLSKYALDAMPYNDENVKITWEESSLRKWLNKDFYEDAFSESERKLIKTVELKNLDNPEHRTDGGNDTEDKVFLLSLEEALNKDFGFLSEPKDADYSRVCEATKYAIARGVQTYDISKMYGAGQEKGIVEACYWYLRSPGSNQYSVCDVTHHGTIDTYGGGLQATIVGIRPAVYLKIK